MAYLGSTQLSSVANPPVLLAGTGGMDQRIAGSSGFFLNNAWKNSGSTGTYQEGRAFGGNMWGYWTTDNSTVIAATGCSESCLVRFGANLRHHVISVAPSSPKLGEVLIL